VARGCHVLCQILAGPTDGTPASPSRPAREPRQHIPGRQPEDRMYRLTPCNRPSSDEARALSPFGMVREPGRPSDNARRTGRSGTCCSHAAPRRPVMHATARPLGLATKDATAPLTHRSSSWTVDDAVPGFLNMKRFCAGEAAGNMGLVRRRCQRLRPRLN
jgi:hypothetical protein